MKAHTKPGTHVPDPIKVPRPDREGREDRSAPAGSAELAAYFGSKKMIVRYSPKTAEISSSTSSIEASS